MNKTYIQPSTRVHKIETIQMLASSDGRNMSVASGNASEWGSRRDNIWNEDDEE